MTVRRNEDGTIVIDGTCRVDDVEALMALLHAEPRPSLDWTGCRQIHTAVLQLILVMKPAIRGPCGDPLVRRWIEVNML